MPTMANLSLSDEIIEEIPIEDHPCFPKELHKVFDIIYLRVDARQVKRNKDILKDIILNGLNRVNDKLKEYRGSYKINLIKVKGEDCTLLFYVSVPKECKIKENGDLA
jgi:hypothetical protein